MDKLDLQQRLERAEKERDMFHNAEMAWEKAMMEVIGEDGVVSVKVTIKYLKSERDALQQQVNALAAENAALMHRIDWPKEQCPVTGSVTDVDPSDYVPATDTAIRELQAQAMDSLAGVAETMLVKFSNAEASGIPEALGWDLVKRQAIQSAYYLRNGKQGGDHA